MVILDTHYQSVQDHLVIQAIVMLVTRLKLTMMISGSVTTNLYWDWDWSKGNVSGNIFKLSNLTVGAGVNPPSVTLRMKTVTM